MLEGILVIVNFESLFGTFRHNVFVDLGGDLLNTDVKAEIALNAQERTLSMASQRGEGVFSEGAGEVTLSGK